MLLVLGFIVCIVAIGLFVLSMMGGPAKVSTVPGVGAVVPPVTATNAKPVVEAGTFFAPAVVVGVLVVVAALVYFAGKKYPDKVAKMKREYSLFAVETALRRLERERDVLLKTPVRDMDEAYGKELDARSAQIIALRKKRNEFV